LVLCFKFQTRDFQEEVRLLLNLPNQISSQKRAFVKGFIYILANEKSLNPNSALGFVAKLDYSIKASAHGLFLMKEYICILRSKIGVSAWF
jgi:hypothetical protein